MKNLNKIKTGIGNKNLNKEDSLTDIGKSLNKYILNPNGDHNFEERKKILVDKLGFTCSDPDNYQFYKKVNKRDGLGSNAYNYLTLTKNGYFNEIISPLEYSKEELLETIKLIGLYDSIEELEDEYGDSYVQILAETIYENEYENELVDTYPMLESIGIKSNLNLDEKQKEIILGLYNDIINQSIDDDRDIIFDLKVFNQNEDLSNTFEIKQEIIDTINQDIKDNKGVINLSNDGFQYNNEYQEEEIKTFLKSMYPLLNTGYLKFNLLKKIYGDNIAIDKLKKGLDEYFEKFDDIFKVKFIDSWKYKDLIQIYGNNVLNDVLENI